MGRDSEARVCEGRKNERSLLHQIRKSCWAGASGRRCEGAAACEFRKWEAFCAAGSVLEAESCAICRGHPTIAGLLPWRTKEIRCAAGDGGDGVSASRVE